VEANDAIHEGTCSGANHDEACSDTFREEACSSDPNVRVPFVV
jgi:hypothetical protein